MHYSELLFFAGFVIFIVAILLVDMFAIDRKAHVGLCWHCFSVYSSGFMVT